LVTLQKAENVKGIFQLKHVLHYIVNVKPYKGQDILQCYRCQRFGYA